MKTTVHKMCKCGQKLQSTDVKILSPFFALVSESSGDTITSPTSENMDAYKDQEEKTARGPLQEHVFAECSRERILGLLAAMLPATKQVTTKTPV